MKRLEGRAAVVTGAAGDIGRAIALAFASEGANVACLDLDSAGASATAAAVNAKQGGIAAVAIACDVSQSESVSWAFRQVEEQFQRLDVLVNNAATVSPYQPVDLLDETAWRKTLDVNLTGAFLMSKYAVPLIRRGARGGAIIHMASQMGHVGNLGRAAYGCTKAALIHLAKIMALDYGEEGIRVNSLSPGAVMTSRLIDRYGSESESKRRLQQLYPVGRLGTAEEIAAAAVFLASDDAKFITGTDLLVDGGYTAR